MNTSPQSVAVYTAGDRSDAPTIVFLHGIGVSSWMWDAQIAALSPDFHCLAIDLPGSGESHTLEWQSFKAATPHVAQVIRTQAHGGKAHIVGLSLGGHVALQLLADFPELLLSVIVSGVTTTPLQHGWLLRPLLKLMTPFMLRDSMIDRSVNQMSLPPDAAASTRRDMQRLSPTTMQRAYDELFTFDLASLLHGQTPVRLLAVAGEKESLTILNSLQDFLALQPTSNRAVYKVPNAHHGWSAEFPQLFADMIRAWVCNTLLPNALIELR
jgi:pimeloyl-ACP methyl ester carboxylesterase